MLESAATLVQEYADLEARLAEPAVHSDQDLVRQLNKRYAALAPTVAAYHAWHAARDDVAAARELATQDTAFAAELPALEAVQAAAEDTLRRLLVPRDPDDERDIILEVKAGEGGEETHECSFHGRGRRARKLCHRTPRMLENATADHVPIPAT